MSTKQDRIAGLLVQGMKPAMVATIVGCDPSYISQLLKDEAFLYHLQELNKELVEGEAIEDASVEDRKQETLFLADKMLAAEHHALDKILKEMPYLSGRDAVVALDVIGKRKDATLAQAFGPKGILPAATPVPGHTTVQVTLTVPNICIPELTLSSNNEIISIGERSVAAMPTATLKQMLAKADEPPLEVSYENHASLAAAL